MSQLSDTQSESDSRGLPIDRVGIRGVRYPIRLEGQSTVGTFSLTVDLPADQRGTHMSRFVEILEQYHSSIDPAVFVEMVRRLRDRLHASYARVEMSASWFMTKAAPITGGHGTLEFETRWEIELQGREVLLTKVVVVPVSTVCPCSKAISERGAHNQRGHVTLAVRTAKPVPTNKLVALVEAGASCDLYSLLKRPDEKFVTERAYDNPVFVEDLVRNVAERTLELPGLLWFCVEAENFESIHNHNAYARIVGPTGLQPAPKAARKRRR